MGLCVSKEDVPNITKTTSEQRKSTQNSTRLNAQLGNDGSEKSQSTNRTDGTNTKDGFSSDGDNKFNMKVQSESFTKVPTTKQGDNTGGIEISPNTTGIVDSLSGGQAANTDVSPAETLDQVSAFKLNEFPPQDQPKKGTGKSGLVSPDPTRANAVYKKSVFDLSRKDLKSSQKRASKQRTGSGSQQDTLRPLEETYKVLLLGVGESGKSTVLKQFKILHQGGYTQEELLAMKGVIYKNLLDISDDLIKARYLFKIPIAEDELEAFPAIPDVSSFEAVLKMEIPDRSVYIQDEKEDTTNIESLPSLFFAYLAILWNAVPTQALLHSKHRKSFHLLGNASYFINRLESISKQDYVPTVEDVLKCRLKTKGIQETFVKMKEYDDVLLHIYDVGGQRVERKNWIYCFSNVSIIIFCVSLSDYDKPLKEDPRINALSESIELFDSIVNSKWFVNTQVMLFLNKIDLFLEKLPYSPIKKYFPDYSGDDTDAKSSVKHILGLLKARNRSHLPVYPHITQATDSSNIELVFTAMAETVMENRIKTSGAI